MFSSLLFFILIQIKLSFEDPLVTLPNGQIRGREDRTSKNKTYYAFQKIPYAAPPVGDLRFKPPQPAQNWDGILNTTSLDVTCYLTTSDSASESEDCLFINVYTPQLPSDNSSEFLPVLFYIHGGGFVAGSSKPFYPDNFVNNDIVLATVNYRVGIFGFLSTQDDVISGNYGLKDQSLAIEWAHNNIHLFGGDPEKITIYGESAGSASCAYQLLNQENAGLFRGAILGSGTFLSPWAFQRNARQIAFATASILNASFANSDDSAALLEFLQNVDARSLDGAAGQFYNDGSDFEQISQGFYYAPVVEAEISDAFLTKKMYGLLQAGDVVAVPMLIGLNSEEGLTFNSDPEILKTVTENLDANLDLLVPDDMEITDDTAREEMGSLIRKIYTGGEPLAQHLGDAVRYSSDTSFTRSIIRHAEIYSKIAETYFYQFSYDGKTGKFDVHYDGADSVAHGEELKYLFCSKYRCDLSEDLESDQIVQKRLVKMITDFVKYQNPTPEPSDLMQEITWPLVATDDGDFFYVDIGENLEIRNHPKNNTYRQWIELYNSLGYDDFDTY